MLENIKAVNNPLTIIAIFAALAEVAGTVALKMVGESLQVTFIWFVMLFPVLIVISFFLTLNFNPRVLYAPSDFKDEENFLNVIGGVNKLSLNLEDVQAQLETARIKIVEEATKQIGVAGESERARLTRIVNEQIEAVQKRVENTQESAHVVADGASSSAFSETVNRRIIDLLTSVEGLMTYAEIKENLIHEFPLDAIRISLAYLSAIGKVESDKYKGGPLAFKLKRK